MKIAIFGASGKIGSSVVEHLSPKYKVIKIGSRTGDLVADYTDAQDIESVFRKATDLASVVVAVGGGSAFQPYGELDDDDFRFGDRLDRSGESLSGISDSYSVGGVRGCRKGQQRERGGEQ